MRAASKEGGGEKKKGGKAKFVIDFFAEDATDWYVACPRSALYVAAVGACVNLKLHACAQGKSVCRQQGDDFGSEHIAQT